jgi:hypothetical protein
MCELSSLGSHGTTADTTDRIPDYPHLNATLTHGYGPNSMAHLYHTPTKPAAVIIATVGLYQDNADDVRDAYGRKGYFLLGRDLVLGAMTR